MRPFRHPTDLYDFIEPQVRLLTKIPYLNFKKSEKMLRKLHLKMQLRQGLVK